MTQFIAILAVFGLTCVVWLAYGWLLLPGGCPITVLVAASGGGEDLEYTVKGLLWLRRTGILRGDIAIQDGGLTREGQMVAQALTKKDGVRLWGRETE